MNKILKVTFVILLIGTFVNFGFTLKKNQHKVVKLEKQNQFLKKQKQIYQTSVKLMFDKNSVSLPDTLDFQYAVYFPSQACGKCLEDLLFSFEEDGEIKENLMVYFDNPDRVGIVEHFNDMYGTSYTYITGKPLFHEEQSKISLLKISKGFINGGVIVEAENVIDFKSLLLILKGVW